MKRTSQTNKQGWFCGRFKPLSAPLHESEAPCEEYNPSLTVAPGEEYDPALTAALYSRPDEETEDAQLRYHNKLYVASIINDVSVVFVCNEKIINKSRPFFK
jgi:hypothetical protein